VADALSRWPNLCADDSKLQLNVLATSTVVPSWLTEVTSSYEENEEAKNIEYTCCRGYNGAIHFGIRSNQA
jgi:hypothetical protein